MPIYILDNDPQLSAQYLDDKSLENQIKDIARVLCNVHHLQSDYINDPDYFDDDIPLSYSLHAIKKMPLTEWTQFARECKANYLRLVEFGLACMAEHCYPRCLGAKNKYMEAILWARDNVPDLPTKSCEGTAHIFGECKCCKSYEGKPTPYPLVMPKKYQIGLVYKDNEVTIKSYRNYYKSNLDIKTDKLLKLDKPSCSKDFPKWTKRPTPEFLKG